MNRIKELRKEKNLSQSELGDLLVAKHQAVSKYERGQLDLSTETIARLCEIFACTSDYLLGLSSQRTAQISDADAALVDAYHAAPESVRAGIDALLQPYREEKGSSASPAEKEA